tara:strand:- start:11294 stop:11602 length:309 start_codon:yes stop_codon:yes gene_type:complete
MNNQYFRQESQVYTNVNGIPDFKQMIIDYNKKGNDMGQGKLYIRNNDDDKLTLFNEGILKHLKKRRKKRKSLKDRILNITKKKKKQKKKRRKKKKTKKKSKK